MLGDKRGLFHTCTPMFIASLFTIDKTLKQPKCPSTDERIKKKWSMYTMNTSHGKNPTQNTKKEHIVM